MTGFLPGIHAAAGEFGVFAFLWIFVEMLNPTTSRIKRAKIAALLGVIFILASWFIGGYSYVTNYGPNVKPLIKAGPFPAAHGIVMEAKEHIFLFLPFLAIAGLSLFSYDLLNDKKARRALLLISSLIILLGLAMAGMGYLISSSARTALEVAVGK